MVYPFGIRFCFAFLPTFWILAAARISVALDEHTLDRTPVLAAAETDPAAGLADELAEAMEARGFGAPQRTFLREYRFRARDAALVGAALALALLMIWR